MRKPFTGLYLRCGSCEMLIGINEVFVSLAVFHRLTCPCGETFYVTIAKQPPLQLSLTPIEAL